MEVLASQQTACSWIWRGQKANGFMLDMRQVKGSALCLNRQRENKFVKRLQRNTIFCPVSRNSLWNSSSVEHCSLTLKRGVRLLKKHSLSVSICASAAGSAIDGIAAIASGEAASLGQEGVESKPASSIDSGNSIDSRTDSEEEYDKSSSVEVRVLMLKAQDLTPESFAPFGQVVAPTEDGTQFGPEDASLDLSHGIPRVYVMRLRDKPLKFDRITHHAYVTQCLGAIGVATDAWYLAVAPPSLKGASSPSEGDSGELQAERSSAGHWYIPPRPEEVVAFRIEGPQVVKLHIGTWHAGPFFKGPSMDFCNLELSNTNVVDHTTHVFRSKDNVAFEIVDERHG